MFQARELAFDILHKACRSTVYFSAKAFKLKFSHGDAFRIHTFE